MTELINIIDATLNINKQTVRSLMVLNEQWFVAKDVCDRIGLTNISEAMRILPNDWKDTKIINTHGGNQNLIIIKEPAIYKLLLRSKTVMTQMFQDFVCEEILPSFFINKAKAELFFQLLNQLRDVKNELLTQQDLLLKEKEKNNRSKFFSDKNVVYLMTSDSDEKLFCIAKAIDLKTRLQEIDNPIYEFGIVCYVSCKTVDFMDLLEKIMIEKFCKYRISADRDVFLLPQSETVTLFINIFDECVNEYQIYKTDNTKEIIISETMKIRCLQQDDNIWFVANEICVVLELSNVTETLRPLPLSNIKTALLQCKSGVQKQNMKIINIDGLKQILKNTRSVNANLFIKPLRELDIELNTIFVCKEASFLRIISASFAHVEQQKQYKIGEYKIDLYFPIYKLAIECDEYNHKNRNSILEKNRQKFIEDSGINFIRFNPDEECFNIGVVINRIFQYILQFDSV